MLKERMRLLLRTTLLLPLPAHRMTHRLQIPFEVRLKLFRIPLPHLHLLHHPFLQLLAIAPHSLPASRHVDGELAFLERHVDAAHFAVTQNAGVARGDGDAGLLVLPRDVQREDLGFGEVCEGERDGFVAGGEGFPEDGDGAEGECRLGLGGGGGGDEFGAGGSWGG